MARGGAPTESAAHVADGDARRSATGGERSDARRRGRAVQRRPAAGPAGEGDPRRRAAQRHRDPPSPAPRPGGGVRRGRRGGSGAGNSPFRAAPAFILCRRPFFLWAPFCCSLRWTPPERTPQMGARPIRRAAACGWASVRSLTRFYLWRGPPAPLPPSIPSGGAAPRAWGVRVGLGGAPANPAPSYTPVRGAPRLAKAPRLDLLHLSPPEPPSPAAHGVVPRRA